MSTFNDWAGEDEPASVSEMKVGDTHLGKSLGTSACPSRSERSAGAGAPDWSRRRHKRCSWF